MLSVGCSALFTDDLADNGATPGSAGATGVAGRAGTAGAAGAAGIGGGNTGGSAGARAGSGGAAGAGGQAGTGSGGKAGSSGASAGNAGAGATAGQGGAGPLGGSGGAATGGSGQAGGQAGSGNGGGTGGVGASAGTGGTSAGSGGSGAGTGGASGGTAGTGAAAGAAGAAGMGAASGAGGAGGTNGCPQLPPGQPPPNAQCGNGVVEAGEECDVGGGIAEDGCSDQCLLTCVNGVRVGRSCYAVSNNTFRGEQVFVTPPIGGLTVATAFLADFADGQACAHLVGPTSHIAVLNRTGERAALLASAEFKAHLTTGVSGTKNGSAWLAVGYRWLIGGQVDDPTRWAWSEGGAVDPTQWAPGYPQNDGVGPGGNDPDGCGSIDPSLSLENHGCETLRRPVLCEREPACAMRASAASPWQIGYQGENGHCYLRLAQQTSYENAASACQALGAHLAAFETIEEVRALPGVTSGLSDLWIGAKRNACGAGNGQADDPFVWSTNGAVVPTGTDVGYWVPGEPNNSQNNERCAQITRSHGLNDAACGGTFRALCERDY